MKRSFAVSVPVLLSASLLLSACGHKAADVATQFETTFNGNQPEAIMAMFADEPYVNVDGESMLNNDEIVSWLSRVLPKKPQMVSTSGKSGSHGKLAWTATIERTDWKSLGLGPEPYKVEAVVDGDKLKMLTLTMDPESRVALKATLDNRNAKWLAAFQDAVKTRNGPAVLQLVTDDFRLDIPDAKAPLKKAGIAGWVKDLEKQNAELTCCVTKRDDTTWTGTLATDKYRELNLETVDIDSRPTFAEDGHIRSYAFSLSADAKTKIETATTNAATTAESTPPKKHK